MMLEGRLPPQPDGLMLLEDMMDIWSISNALGRTYPAYKWVDEWAAQAGEDSLSKLL
jgi:hypothetical protein